MKMHRVPEKTCNKCGTKYFTRQSRTCPDCDGTMCTIITPVPGKRVSGVLCRDGKTERMNDEICFFPNASLSDVILGGDRWLCNTVNIFSSWSREQWKEQYGKLPRKGSKQAVIIELTSG